MSVLHEHGESIGSEWWEGSWIEGNDGDDGTRVFIEAYVAFGVGGYRDA